METSRRSGVRAGSVWESRMQCDEVKNGIFRAFDIQTTDNNNDNEQNESGGDETEEMSKKDSRFSVTEKRRTCKSGDEKSPVQIGRTRSDLSEDQCRRTPLKLTRPRSNTLLRTKKSPVQSDKVRSEAVTPARRSFKSGFSEVKEKTSPVSVKKARSESMGGNETTLGRVRKTRSELCNEVVKSDESGSGPLRKVNSSPAEILDDQKKQPEPLGSSDRSEDDEEEEVAEDEQQNPDHEVKEFGVCHEKIDSTKRSISEDKDDEKEKGEEVEVEVEVEAETEVEEKENVEVKEVNVIKRTNNRVVDEIKSINHQSRDRTRSSPSTACKVINRDSTEAEQRFPQRQSKLQSLVDLVMWREVSRSALVFGIGTFLIISSSYAKDLEFSFISAVAYAGLVYLAANFVFRSLVHRGEGETGGEEMMREEEAIRMVRFILPYLHEFLFTLRAFFSGDPSTTIKMGVVLFVLARCGSSITIWKMAKLGFFLVFTVPKIFTSYSTYLSAYAQFWVRRFRDAWESCTHKKAVALALFTLVWNLSSVVVRVWAVFMLFVALRYYQQRTMVNGEWTEEEEEENEEDEKKQEEEEKPKVVRRASRVVRKQTTHFSNSNRFLIPNKLKKSS